MIRREVLRSHVAEVESADSGYLGLESGAILRLHGPGGPEFECHLPSFNRAVAAAIWIKTHGARLDLESWHRLTRSF